MTLSGRRLTERNHEITRLYVEGGLTLREVGRRFDLSHERVRQILEKAGARRRRKDRTQRNQEIIRLYLEDGLSLRQVGLRFGLSRTTISSILARAGLRRRAFSRAKVPPEDMWRRTLEVVHLYTEKRLKLKEVGARFRLSHVQVINILEATGVTRRSRAWRSHWPWRDAAQRTEEISRAYIDEQLSLKQVGARFGLSPECVRQILERAGVSRRSCSWRPPRRSKDQAQRNQEIIRLCMEDGLKHKEVATRFALRPETISRILTRAGVRSERPK